MANTRVRGQIIFAVSGNGIPSLTVCAFDIDPFGGEDKLGEVDTDPAGNFSITYTADQYREWILDRNPDIEVRIFGPGQRLLWATKVEEDVQQDTLQIEPIRIHEHNFPVPDSASPEEQQQDESWLVTHTSLDPANAVAKRLTTGSQLDWLIDGDTMFPAITDAIDGATASIRFMNLAFYIGELYSKFDFPNGKDHKTFLPSDPITVSRVEQLLKKKANDQGVAVNVLVWELSDFKDLLVKLFDKADTADEVRDFFEGSQVKTSSLETSQLLHIKLLVVDGHTAFVIGSTMSPSYFNDREHLIRDVRHRGRQLMHDVSLCVKGPAVHDLDETFTTIWNIGPTVAPLTPSPATSMPPGDIGVQVLRTLPGEMFAKDPPNTSDPAHVPFGETGILESYQRAIMKAEEYIYIEDQYFVSDEIATAIMLRMKEKPKLEVILVLNVEPDIGGYPRKQAALINEIRTSLGDRPDRLGVFTLWSTEARPAKPFEIAHIYVHSKLAIIDDKWATVGTANVDGASLNQRQWGLIVRGEAKKAVDKLVAQIAGMSVKKQIAIFILGPVLTALALAILSPLLLLLGAVGLQFSLPSLVGTIFKSIVKEIARPSQHASPHANRQPPRHPELNLVVYNGVAGQTPTSRVRELRQALWTEHLQIASVADTTPAEGWLGVLWDPVARINLTELQAAATLPGVPVTTPVARVLALKWVPEAKPKNALEALGVKVKNITLRSGGEEVPFNKVERP